MFRLLLAFLLIAALIAALPQHVAQTPDADFARGIASLQQQNWQAAISSFRKSLDSHPRHADTLFYLAQAYFLSGQIEPALAAIEEASRLEPDIGAIQQKYGEYLCTTQCSKGLERLLDARRLDPELEHIDFDVGMAYYRVANLESATQNLEAALRREPGNAEAAFFLGECYARKPDWPRAEEMYRRALAKGKGDAATLYGLGRALLAGGEAGAALPFLEKALAIDPSLAECHFQMARALRVLGRKEEAAHQLEIFKAIQERLAAPSALSGVRDPGQEAVWDACQRLIEQGEEQEALKRLRAAGGQNAHYLLGTLYYSMGRFADARRVLNVAVAANPQDADTLAGLGRTELALGDIQSAAVSLQRALESDPRNQLALAGMGALKHTQQRWAESADWIERSRTREPATLLDLCDDYLQLGRRQDAEITAELIRGFGAGDQAVLAALAKLFAHANVR